MLSNTAMPSATTMLGYGNPMNSPVVASFIKCFILNDVMPVVSIDYTDDLAEVEERLAEVTVPSGSNLYLEEAFSYAMLMKLLPNGLSRDQTKAWRLLSMIDRRFPEFLDQRRVEAFDLLSRFDPQRAERNLEALIQYKEMIGVRDEEYEEATTLLNGL